MRCADFSQARTDLPTGVPTGMNTPRRCAPLAPAAVQSTVATRQRIVTLDPRKPYLDVLAIVPTAR
eukprot:6201822-Pleurochrysis_carterae.AAC.1